MDLLKKMKRVPKKVLNMEMKGNCPGGNQDQDANNRLRKMLHRGK